MKIGDVARETGLSEKAIRVYVENGLVKPEVTKGLHRNSYDFTRQNVRELERIAVFRKAGFSLFEISIIFEQPHRLPELLESKRQSLEMEQETAESVKDALDRLQSAEVGDVDMVTLSLRHAVANRKEPKPRASRRWVYLTLIVGVSTAVYLWLHFIGIYHRNAYYVGWVPLTPEIELTIGGCLTLIAGLIGGFMALRYAGCTRRAGRLPQQGRGTVIRVMEEHGFDGSYARAGSGSAGTREPGIGGTWQIHFLLWNEIRPDCWFPVIRYTDETGTERSDTFSYGGFRQSWKPGDEISIAWDPKAKGYIHPLEGKWLTQKALLYGAATLLLLTLSLWMWLKFAALTAV